MEILVIILGTVLGSGLDFLRDRAVAGRDKRVCLRPGLSARISSELSPSTIQTA